MRAYIATIQNMASKEDYNRLSNEEAITGKQLTFEQIEAATVKAAFLSLPEAMDGAGNVLYEIEKEFDENEHFQRESGARISLTIDIKDISEDEFNEINERYGSGEGTFFVSARPLNEAGG